MIPSYLIEYYFDGELREPEITAFEVARQQTDEKADTADCIVTLEDEFATRTMYLTLYLQYWDKGGWMLDSWEYTQAEELAFKNDDHFDSVNFLRKMVENGYDYNGMELQSMENSDDDQSVIAIYHVSYDGEYGGYDGYIDCTANLTCRADYDGVEYNWAILTDDSEVYYTWNILGEYYIDFLPNTYGFTSSWKNVKPTITASSINGSSAPLDRYSEVGFATYHVEFQDANTDKLFNWGEKESEIERKGSNPQDMRLMLKLYPTRDWTETSGTWTMYFYLDHVEICGYNCIDNYLIERTTSWY